MNQSSMPTEGGWRAKAAEWLFSQGVSTVLLALILLGIYRAVNYAMDTAVPAHLQKIQQGYVEIQQSNEQQIKWLAETFERERKAEREHAKESVQSIKELTAEIRQSRSDAN